eukprot:scpid95006/ scgid22284/ 
MVDIFADATYSDASDIMKLIDDVNRKEVYRVDAASVCHSTKAVKLRAVATRVTRIRVQVSTIDISEDGFISKLPESTCDMMEVRRRTSNDNMMTDWVEPLVHLRTSDTSSSYCVSRKRSWINPSLHEKK